jgi:quinol monooxygenase YgiN
MTSLALPTKSRSGKGFGARLAWPALLLVCGIGIRAHADNGGGTVSRQESATAPVVLISRMTAKPGKLHELEAVLQKFYESVRVAEPDCLINIMHTVSVPPQPSGPPAGPSPQASGDLAFSTVGPVEGALVFYEVYRNPAAAAAHTRTPHFLELKERLKVLIDGPIQLEFLKEVAGVRVPYPEVMRGL